MSDTDYAALSTETLAHRLGATAAIADRIGGAPETWSVREVGDGNLNLVFIVEGSVGAVVVKQALPYVRLVGDSWPLPLYRAFYEYHALTRQADRDPGTVPEIFHFDEAQALIVMEYLSPHVILRRQLIDGVQVAGLGAFCGRFCARTAFRGSELSMPSPEKKADVALFAGNVEIPAITEDLVFTDPYFAAEMNNHTAGLDAVVAGLRADPALIVAAQQMKQKFVSHTETLLHGDLHSGSIMTDGTNIRIIDPEFVQYGPFGFDLGMLTANFLMAYFSQPAHRGGDLEDYQTWILSVIEETYTAFAAEFRHLWATERTGILYPRSVFEDQGHSSDGARDALLGRIVQDSFAFSGIEMHRRCLSLAHNADFEDIADEGLRARLEARNLMFGAELVKAPQRFADAAALTARARHFNHEDLL